MPVATTYQDVASGNPQKLKLLAEKNDIVATYSLVCSSITLPIARIIFLKSFLTASNLGSFQRTWRSSSALSGITVYWQGERLWTNVYRRIRLYRRMFPNQFLKIVALYLNISKYYYVQTRLRVALFMAKALKKTDWNCKFTISNANIDRMFAIVWSFQKKWRYTEAFNHRLVK